MGELASASFQPSSSSQLSSHPSPAPSRSCPHPSVAISAAITPPGEASSSAAAATGARSTTGDGEVPVNPPNELDRRLPNVPPPLVLGVPRMTELAEPVRGDSPVGEPPPLRGEDDVRVCSSSLCASNLPRSLATSSGSRRTRATQTESGRRK